MCIALEEVSHPYQYTDSTANHLHLLLVACSSLVIG